MSNAWYNPAPKRRMSRGTIEATLLIARARDGFRRLYGPDATPEEMPREWAAVIKECRETWRDA